MTSGRVYEKLRSAIVEGVYAPGSRLKEIELGRHLGVSRTPVRDALRQLEIDGLVKLEPHRSAVVRVPREDDLQDVFDLRSVLEGLCAARAALNLTAGQLAELKGMLEQQEKIARGRRSEARASSLTAENTRFHGAIVAASGNQRLATVIRMTELSNLFKNRFWDSDQDRVTALVFHRQLVECFKARDPIRAEAVMRAHVLAAKDYCVKELRAANGHPD